jgi:hypothetical protein
MRAPASFYFDSSDLEGGEEEEGEGEQVGAGWRGVARVGGDSGASCRGGATGGAARGCGSGASRLGGAAGTGGDASRDASRDASWDASRDMSVDASRRPFVDMSMDTSPDASLDPFLHAPPQDESQESAIGLGTRRRRTAGARQRNVVESSGSGSESGAGSIPDARTIQERGLNRDGVFNRAGGATEPLWDVVLSSSSDSEAPNREANLNRNAGLNRDAGSVPESDRRSGRPKRPMAAGEWVDDLGVSHIGADGGAGGAAMGANAGPSAGVGAGEGRKRHAGDEAGGVPRDDVGARGLGTAAAQARAGRSLDSSDEDEMQAAAVAKAKGAGAAAGSDRGGRGRARRAERSARAKEKAVLQKTKSKEKAIPWKTKGHPWIKHTVGGGGWGVGVGEGGLYGEEEGGEDEQPRSRCRGQRRGTRGSSIRGLEGGAVGGGWVRVWVGGWVEGQGEKPAPWKTKGHLWVEHTVCLCVGMPCEKGAVEGGWGDGPWKERAPVGEALGGGGAGRGGWMGVFAGGVVEGELARGGM